MNEVEQGIKDIMTKTIQSDFKKFYIKGFIAGYKTCYKTIYKKIENMTSAKQIKSFIKSEADKIKLEENSD